MNKPRIGFIGGGNMASCLIGGLVADGHPAHLIQVSEPDEIRRQSLEVQGIASSHDHHGITGWADIMVLAVKPQIMKNVCLEIAASLKVSKPLVVSVAAGITIASMEKWLGAETAIVRSMPNTPAMVQTAATGLYANPRTNEEQRNNAETLLRSVGITLWVEEEALLDTVTAVSGSGPAYFFLLMEAMEKAAVDMGLDESSARLLIEQTVLGAGRMALESGVPPAELRKRVTSPGGTTEQAIGVFENQHLQQIVKSAMEAACTRAQTLAKQLGD